MTTCSVCLHTNDKKYQEFTPPAFQIENPITHATKFHSKALNNSIWAEKKIYWRMDSNYQWIDTKTIERMLRASFLEASMHTPLIINQKRRSTSDAHIIINWLGKKDEPYFKSDSTLAFGYGPAKGLGGNITMNSDVIWRLDTTPLTVEEAYNLGMIENYDRNNPDNILRTYDPLHTTKHEGGHALGMRHIELESERYTATMFPFYNGTRRFGAADLNYLGELYGEASVYHETKEYLRDKIFNFRDLLK